ncbi:unnamed protein product [Paramecium pentaurelia]|uniref:Uncharacterized protein n=1 Tax=Paramecium pentaurelia TaxID=43138 RepID=A0A8S1X1X6_9CILI|nr:unnamed protein product [Paramecium pentaurelia]CAD8196153.1 unnamed protein product [Paramecium pentaurelia]
MVYISNNQQNPQFYIQLHIIKRFVTGLNQNQSDKELKLDFEVIAYLKPKIKEINEILSCKDFSLKKFPQHLNLQCQHMNQRAAY